MEKGIFGRLFDFDGNGRIDAFEHAAELQFLDIMMTEEESNAELTGVEPAMPNLDSDKRNGESHE